MSMEVPVTLVSWAHRCFPILFFVFIIMLERYQRHRRFLKLTGAQSPHSKAPVRDPFIGLDFVYDKFVRRLPDESLKDYSKRFKKFGSTYVVSRWTSELIHTCDAKNIQQILASGFEDFRLPKVRTSAISGVLGNGIFALDGGPWSHARGELRQTVKKQKIDALPPTLEDHIQALFKRVPVNGTTLDLQPLFFSFTMDVATDFLMGRSTHTLNSSSQAERNQQFIDDYMLCSEYAARRMNLGPLSPLHRDATANQASRRVLQYVDDYIDESLKMDHKDPQTDHNYIQDLATAVGNRKTLRDHVLHLLLASRDTTATLLSNLFFALAKKPLVYAKLREEVVRTFGDKVPTFEQLKDMQYLKWCINECKSTCPPTPICANPHRSITAAPGNP